MPATAKGIYHNLKESEYVISNKEVTFFFSSTFYLNKFMNGYHDNRKKFIKKIKNEMNNQKLHLNMETLADINYYKMIEKRGFFAILKGVEMNWHDLQKYALRKMTEKNTLDWSKIPRPRLSERLRM